jgi:hypothetical protein
MQYQYREWSPTVQGMQNAFGRKVEWTAANITTQTEKWAEGQVLQLGNLTCQLLMGERRGFGSNHWCRTIQGAYLSIRPDLPPTYKSSRDNEVVIEQIKILHSQSYALRDFTMYTDGGWEYGGDVMDAPFYPYTDSPSHKGRGSILFITTDLTRIKDRIGTLEHADQQTPDHVAIRMGHGKVIGRVPNPQELLALLGALAIHDRLECKTHTDQRIGSDCKSLVDYINDYRHTQMRNEVGKLRFLLAI